MSRFLIHLKGMRDAFEVEEAKGRKLLEMLENGSPPDTVVRVGDRLFRLEGVRSVEPAPAQRSDRPAEPPPRKLTPEDRARIAGFVKKNQEILIARGVVGAQKKGGPYTLKRSKLNEYREKFGADYRLPAGAVIEEDV